MPPSSSNEPSGGLLRPRDRTSILALVGCGLVLLAVMWVKQGGLQGNLVEIDRAPPLIAKFQVDVNRADWPELVQLPGIGLVLAQKWIAERERHGPFRTLEELSRIDGIGPRTLERLRPYLSPIPKDSAVVAR